MECPGTRLTKSYWISSTRNALALTRAYLPLIEAAYQNTWQINGCQNELDQRDWSSQLNVSISVSADVRIVVNKMINMGQTPNCQYR